MATEGTVLCTDVVLADSWPKWDSPSDLPIDNFTGTPGGHNVETATYQLGTKMTYYDTSSGGPSTLIYLRFGAAGGDETLACGSLVKVESETNNTGELYYMVNNDNDAQMFDPGVGPFAVAISAMTDNYYGWFWCDGHAPQDKITAFATATMYTYLTAAHGDAGPFMVGDHASEDSNGCVEPTGDLIVIAGYLKNAEGGEA